MTKYNHMFDVFFCIDLTSNGGDANNVAVEVLRDAIISRVFDMSDEELLDHCDILDTYELDKEKEV